MKRSVIGVVAIVVFFIAAGSAFAAPASPAFKNGGIEAQVGIGFGFYGYIGSTSIPPIIASAEYQALVAPQVPLSFGVIAGFTSSSDTVDFGGGNSYSDTATFILIGGRVSYHFVELIKVPNLDTYAGVMLGYAIASVSSSGKGIYANGGIPTLTAGGFAYGLYAGARYYFTPNIGIYGELGYSFGYINAGVAFKL